VRRVPVEPQPRRLVALRRADGANPARCLERPDGWRGWRCWRCWRRVHGAQLCHAGPRSDGAAVLGRSPQRAVRYMEEVLTLS